MCFLHYFPSFLLSVIESGKEVDVPRPSYFPRQNDTIVKNWEDVRRKRLPDPVSHWKSRLHTGGAGRTSHTENNGIPKFNEVHIYSQYSPSSGTTAIDSLLLDARDHRLIRLFFPALKTEIAIIE